MLFADQNRGIGTAASKNVKHTDAPTELHEINHNNNNSITTTISNGTTTTRTNSQTTSPILGHHGKKTTTTPASAATAVTVSGMLLEKVSPTTPLAMTYNTLPYVVNEISFTENTVEIPADARQSVATKVTPTTTLR